MRMSIICFGILTINKFPVLPRIYSHTGREKEQIYTLPQPQSVVCDQDKFYCFPEELMKAKVNGHWLTWEKQMVQIQGLTSSNEGLKFHDSERSF